VSQSVTGDIPERIARLEQQDQRLTRALELLARHEGAPPVKARREWGAYAAVIASIIGIVALAVSGYTAYLQRQQLRAQMWPHLRLEYSSINLAFYATNQGTGPARVTAMRVTVDGAAVGTWPDVMKAAGFSAGEELVWSDLGEAVLAPAKVFTIVEPAENAQSRAKFEELLPGKKHALSVTVCYCSVLDECSVATLGVAREDGKARPSDTCPIIAVERFAN
jgi:hypothetical protein